MHYKIFVIKPISFKIDDVMYNFEELDMNQEEIMNDNRGVFINQISEADVPLLLNKIYEYYSKKKEKYLEYMQYRATHSLKEYQEKFNIKYASLNWYVDCCNVLDEYEKVKDLTLDDVELIKFIKNNSYNISLNDYNYLNLLIYIKGIGFGYFDNPTKIWDYYTVLDNYKEMEFGFLSRLKGNDCNYCLLSELDIDRTLSKFEDCYQYIIFCERDITDCKVYTMDDYHFNKDTGLVDSTDDSLREIYNEYKDYCYDITVLDIHT